MAQVNVVHKISFIIQCDFPGCMEQEMIEADSRRLKDLRRKASDNGWVTSQRSNGGQDRCPEHMGKKVSNADVPELDDELREKLAKWYYGEKLTGYEIADKLGVGGQWVYRAMDHFDMERRGRGEAA
jgi:hypothetical protein